MGRLERFDDSYRRNYPPHDLDDKPTEWNIGLSLFDNS